MDGVRHAGRAARWARHRGREALRDQATAPAQAGVGSHTARPGRLVDVAPALTGWYDTRAPRGALHRRRSRAGTSKHRTAWADRGRRRPADAPAHEALPRPRGGRPQAALRATAARCLESLTTLGATSCSTR